MDKKVMAFDIQKFSIHDGPGIRTIVFFKGCPLRCEWCANPESQNFEPELLVYPDKCVGCGRCIEVCGSGCFTADGSGKMSFDRDKCTKCGKCVEVCYAESRCMAGELMSIEEIKEEVDKDIPFYRNSGGGVTFSGGEPMCHPDIVAELAGYYKEEKGVSTAIETCGFVPWENYEETVKHLDLALFDLKCMNDEKHIKYTGGSNRQILENISRISEIVETTARIPIIPSVNDSAEDIEDFGRFIKELGTISTVHILPYHNYGMNKYNALGKHYSLKELEAPSDEHMENIKKQLEQYGFEVNIGG